MNKKETKTKGDFLLSEVRKTKIIIVDSSTGDSPHIMTDKGSDNIIYVDNLASRKITIICAANSKTKYIESNSAIKETKILRSIELGKGASLSVYSLCTGKGPIASSTNVSLDEESNLKLRNIIVAKKQDQSHDVTVNHNNQNSSSDILSRGLISGSRISLKGLIRINKEAPQSTGFQKSEMLMIEDSTITSRPDLEIHNNDVKCSHGSSITRMETDKIFYLMSRGLGEKDSKRMLMDAYFREITADLQDEMTSENSSIQKIIEENISEMAK